jgi:hypothetical protein
MHAETTPTCTCTYFRGSFNPPRRARQMKDLGGRDLNPDRQNQNLECCHCTTPQ